MILDDRALFSDNQAITVSDLSTSSYDLGVPGVTYDGVQLLRNMGKAGKIPIACQVTEDFDALTSLDIELQTSDTVDGSGDLNGTITTLYTVNVLLADLVAGFQLFIDKLPRGVKNRYVQFNYVVNGAGPTVGRVTSGVVSAVDGAYVG